MKEVMKVALDAANKAMKDASKCIEELGAKNKALEQALAQSRSDVEQHLQALHDENVRLGLYEQGEPVACDGDFPDGFNSSFNISAQALRAANSALCDMTGNRQWDVPCLAKHILNFKEQK